MRLATLKSLVSICSETGEAKLTLAGKEDSFLTV
jgi:hypothetical protein